VLQVVHNSPTPPKWLIVAAEAITDVDITAADSLQTLHQELKQMGVELHFAGLKGLVKDRLSPTVGSAVNRYRSQHAVDWKDCDEA
jgi:MFS superfamily sulfate permease-like transporter